MVVITKGEGTLAGPFALVANLLRRQVGVVRPAVDGAPHDVAVLPPRSCTPVPSGLTTRPVATFFSVPFDSGTNCCHGPVLQLVRIRPSRIGSDFQPPPGSDTQSPVSAPTGAYSNLTAPEWVPRRI